MLPQPPCILYRLYSHTGELLYIGITIHPETRFAEHKRTKPWWPEVARIAIEEYPDDVTAAAAEQAAIRAERPCFNRAHNGGCADYRSRPTPAELEARRVRRREREEAMVAAMREAAVRVVDEAPPLTYEQKIRVWTIMGMIRHDVA